MSFWSRLFSFVVEPSDDHLADSADALLAKYAHGGSTVPEPQVATWPLSHQHVIVIEADKGVPGIQDDVNQKLGVELEKIRLGSRRTFVINQVFVVCTDVKCIFTFLVE